LAVAAVCSVTFHLKSEQVEGVGTTLDVETHVPINALTPVALGLVVVLVCSKPAQPMAATARVRADARMYFFIPGVLIFWRETRVAGEGNYTTRI
jgi:hypothetical protein